MPHQPRAWKGKPESVNAFSSSRVAATFYTSLKPFSYEIIWMHSFKRWPLWIQHFIQSLRQQSRWSSSSSTHIEFEWLDASRNNRTSSNSFPGARKTCYPWQSGATCRKRPSPTGIATSEVLPTSAFHHCLALFCSTVLMIWWLHTPNLHRHKGPTLSSSLITNSLTSVVGQFPNHQRTTDMP